MSFSRAFCITCVNDKIFIHAAVTYIDSSAVQALKDLHQEYEARHIQVDPIGTFEIVAPRN